MQLLPSHNHIPTIPLTFLKLSKPPNQSFQQKLQTFLPLYKQLLSSFIQPPPQYIQIDQPILLTYYTKT
ncbi:hypothetical protein, partial [Staphylococcus capitis]|uniref:hypothetical protein n=1 Tax=Staphylococcus capitis TaxID=29388 RepID=UPI0011A126AD